MTSAIRTNEQQDREDIGSERVSFTCSGCGRDTTIHVGRQSRLDEKRCFKCVGTPRSGRGGGPMKKGRVGTHEGRRTDRKDGATGEQQRAVKRAASQRNAQRSAGTRAKNGTTHRMPCHSYDECNHKKHSVAQGRR